MCSNQNVLLSIVKKLYNKNDKLSVDKFILDIIDEIDIHIWSLEDIKAFARSRFGEFPLAKSGKRHISPIGFVCEDGIFIKDSSISNMIYLLNHELYHIYQYNFNLIYPETKNYWEDERELSADRYGRKIQARYLRAQKQD